MEPTQPQSSSTHFDFIVIGGGSGGYAAARTARETKKRVAIIDSASELGGLCILRGCMPSKTLIYSAEVLHHAKQGHLFGLEIPSAKADMPAVHARKVSVIGEFADYRRSQLESDRFSLFRSSAQFVSDREVELADGTRLSADRFLIATGSRVATPEISGLTHPEVWTSDDVLDLDFIPKHVVVLGGGVVSCELSQFLRRIGAEVTVIQRSARILREFSPEASATIQECFEAEGMCVFTNTQLKQIEKTDQGFVVHFDDSQGSQKIAASHVLNALGRVPATESLNLEAAGVKLEKSGNIRINEYLQTTNPKVYAAGDCCGPFEIVHVAVMQGEIAARHATARDAQTLNYDHLTIAVFTDPQLARVGLTPEEIEQRNLTAVSASYPFDDHGKSILMEEKWGYVAVHADGDSGRILGAECVGRDASELIHALAVAVTLGASVDDLLKVHWYHPTLSEIWTYPLEEIAEQIAAAKAR